MLNSTICFIFCVLIAAINKSIFFFKYQSANNLHWQVLFHKCCLRVEFITNKLQLKAIKPVLFIKLYTCGRDIKTVKSICYTYV